MIKKLEELIKQGVKVYTPINDQELNAIKRLPQYSKGCVSLVPDAALHGSYIPSLNEDFTSIKIEEI